MFLLLSASAVLATPAEDASTRIEEGMTIEQVGAAIGFNPTTVEEHNCGDGDTVALWPCRIQSYTDGQHTLLVYFKKINDKPTWVVQSWYIK